MIRKTIMLAALCALAAMSLAASASATTFIRSGSVTGPLYSGTFHANQVGTSSLVATDGSGKTLACAAGTAAGSTSSSSGPDVTGTLTALTFTNCTSNTFPVIQSCHLVGTSTFHITATGAGTGSITFTNLTIDCKSGTTTVCRHTATSVTAGIGAASGGLANGEHLTFTNAGPISSPSFGCPTSAHFNGTFGPVTTASGSATKVYVNTV